MRVGAARLPRVILRTMVMLAALAGSGCALLDGLTAPPRAEPTGTPAPVVVSTSLEVVAPADLKALLERYLDLARVGSLSQGEAIDDAEWTRLINAAPAQVRELLQSEGYFEPEVRLVRETGEDAVQRRVRLELEPGPRTRVSRVTLEAEGPLERAASADDAHAKQTLEGMRQRWALPPGAPFRNPDWSSAKSGALASLRAAGYATALWSGTGAEVDVERQQARLFLVADSGPLFRYGQLLVEGLATQDLQTVQNLAGLSRGQPVSETFLLDYQERLQKSGLFDSVSVTLDPAPEQADTASVLVRLREAPLQVYSFAVGVSANTGPRASVEHVYRRVFGYAATARNKLEWGRLRQAWDGEISTHPSARLHRDLLGGSVERLESDSDIVLSQRLRLGRAQDRQRIERLYFVEAERSKRTTLPTLLRSSSQADTLAVSVNYHGVWRRLDNLLLPTEGYSLGLQGGVGRSHGSDADSGPFTRLYGRLTAYRPLGRSWYGQARVELGHVIKRNAVAVPDSQLFRAGGDESVRGYAYRSLAPEIDGVLSGGNVLFTGSVEVARPISAALPSLWGAAFIDMGRAADSLKGFDPAVGVGVGLRWRSPVGPLRLDWAWARELRRGRLHFSVGIAF